MKDQAKTKQVLIQELALLKQRIKEMEQSESGYQQTGKKLHEVERRLREVYEHSSDVIYTLDCDFRVTSISNSVERHLGYRAEELVGRSFNDINVVAPESLEAAFKDTIQALAGNIVPTVEYVFIRKDGSRAIGEVSGSPLVEDGKIVGLISIARDITDRKRAEEVLLSSAERYRSLASSIDSMYLVDRDCRYMFMNEGCRRKFGVPLEDIIGKRYNDFHAEENSKQFAKTVEEVFETGKPTQMEHQSEKDQSHLLRTFSPVMDQEGKSITAVTISSKDITDRKRAEEALRESEERFRKLADLTWEGIIIHRGGIILDVNESILKMFGCPAEEVIGQSVLEFLAPESIEPALQKLKESIDTPQLYLEARALRKDKTVFPIEVLGRPIRYKNLDARVMAIRDITERKRAEEAVLESEEKYCNILESMNDSYFETDLRGNMTFCNPMVPKSLGYSPEEMAGMNHRVYMDPENAEIVERNFRDVYRENIPSKVVSYEVIRKDRRKVHVETLFSLIKNKDGHSIGYRGISRDITERKHAEERLRENEDRFNQLAKQSSTIVWEVDAQGLYTYISHVSEAVLGYRPDELVGRMHFYDLHPESGREAFRKAAFAVFDRKELFRNLENAAQTKDGRHVWLSTNGIPLLNTDGILRGYRGSDTDVTSRKQAEEALQESEERYRKVADFTYAWEYWLAPDGKYVYVSPACERISGYRAEEFHQDPNLLEKIIHPDDRHRLAVHIHDVLQGKSDACELEFRIITRNNEDRWIGHECQDVYGRDGTYLGRRGSNRDITDRKRVEEVLRDSENRYRELSIIDDLTRLYNSRYFYQQLKMEIDRVDRYGQPLTLLLLDLDSFKVFNDTYGHIEGDGVLSRFGQVVKRCLRQTDSAYRYGGEEFTILLPMTASADGAITAERIRTEFKKEIFSPGPGQDVHMTGSIGLAQYMPQEEMKAFVHRVDQLMYQGKKNGKDRVCSES